MLFASELKALIAASGTQLRIEPGALVASMLYYWLPEERCAIDGVEKLPGGTWARCTPGWHHDRAAVLEHGRGGRTGRAPTARRPEPR